MYYLFAGHRYYPAGGVCDFVSRHDEFKDALAASKKHMKENVSDTWWEIANVEMEVVGQGIRT